MKKMLKLIGWREWIGLPDFGVKKIKVKVDSGARTCALHASKIRILKAENGGKTVSFVVHTNKSPAHHIRVHAPLVELRKVKSSMGHLSLRPVIRTRIQIGDDSWETEVTLVNRDPMGFRMLLGRQALKGRFLIHPSRSFIQSSTDGDKK